MKTRQKIGKAIIKTMAWAGIVGVVLFLVMLNLAAFCQILGGGENRWAPLAFLIPESLALVATLGFWLARD